MGNQGGVYTWSQTAAANATADNTVNWQEGQAPSSINDSGRAMMASVAKFRDDISGSIVTTGTSTAYIVSSNQQFDSTTDFDGKTIAFTPHATNAAGPVTVTVDGFANLPLRTAPNVELGAGVIVLGTPYVARFNKADNALYLQGFYGNPFNVPIGAGMDFWGTTLPNSSFAFPIGQAISRTAFAALFAIMGTTYGAGDGSTTFNLPNKSGRVSAMIDASGTILTSATVSPNGDTLGAIAGGQTEQLLLTNLPSIPLAVSGGISVTSNRSDIQLDSSGSTTPAGGGSSAEPVTNTGAVTSTGTANLTGTAAGTDTAFSNLQPTILCNYIIRII